MQNANHLVRGLLMAAATIATVLLIGCFGHPLSTREKGTLVGGAGGGGTGALLETAVGAPWDGAAVDGAIGAGAGSAVGDALQNQQTANTANRAELNQQQYEINSNHQQLNDLSQVE